MFRLMEVMMLLLWSWCCYLSTRATKLARTSTVEAVAMNEMILMDSIQINPGDAYSGQQQGSMYSNPHYLKQLGYTARSTSMEQSPALCMTYKRADRVRIRASSSSSSSSSSSNTGTNYGIFQNNRNSTAWVTAYCQGIHRILKYTIICASVG